MYYILKVKRQTENDIIIKGTLYNIANEVVIEIFDDGISLKDKIQGVFTLIINEENTTKGKLTDKLAGSAKSAGFILMINKKVKMLFDSLDIKNIEYYQMNIKGKDIHTQDYMIANVLHKVDCIDNSKSEIKYDEEGFVDNVEKLAFDETKIPNELKIFLLDKFLLAEVVIHDTVKEAIEANGITGFTYESVEDYKY